MGWITAFFPTGPRRRRIADLEAEIASDRRTVEQLKDQARGNMQAVQSGTRVLTTMTGMLKLVAEGNGGEATE